MIGGEDQRGGAAVFRHGLERLPQNPGVLIDAVRGFQIQIVAAGVGPLVGFAQQNGEHAGFFDPQKFQSRVENKGVKRFRMPVFGFRFAGIEQCNALVVFRHAERFVARVDKEPGAGRVEDPGEQIPGAEDGHAVFEARAAVEEFEDVHVGVVAPVVAVDARVGDAAEGFAVAGVGEVEPVGDARFRAARAVAEDLSFARNNRPEEGQQRGAAVFGGFAPESSAESGRIGHAARLSVHERRVSAGENLLPAQAVGHENDDVLRLARRLGGDGQSRNEKEGCGAFHAYSPAG